MQALANPDYLGELAKRYKFNLSKTSKGKPKHDFDFKFSARTSLKPMFVNCSSDMGVCHVSQKGACFKNRRLSIIWHI
jgi:hypothetical protein